MGSASICLAGLLLSAILLCSCKTTQEAQPKPVSKASPVPELSPRPEPIPELKPLPSPPLEPIQPEAPLIPGIARQAERLGASAERLEDGFWRVMGSEGEELLLEESSRRAALNGITLFLSEPFKRRLGGYALSDSDFETILVPAMTSVIGALRSKTIVIDPGHGGSENGARNDGLNLLEKDLNLEVSNRLRELLEKDGYKVVLTRYDDRLVPLEERSRIANRANAGLFISIHFNAALNGEAVGLETYMLTPAGAISTGDEEAGEGSHAWPGNSFDQLNFKIGATMQRRIVEDLQRVDRGFKRARFKVLKDLECPGVLVECGFLSNDKEALLVNTPVYRQKLAEALAQVLVEFSHKSAEGV